MIKPNPRTIRFLRILYLNFAKLVAIVFLAATVGGCFGYLIVQATEAYGSKIVLLCLGGVWLIFVLLAISGSISEGQLTRMEAEEEEVMRKLRMPYRE